MDAARDLLRTDNGFVRWRLGYGAFIGAKYPYFYMETPKAACTTTKALLWRLEGLGPRPCEANRLHERPWWDRRRSPLTVPEEQAREALVGGSVFRFFVWRDPVARQLSAYNEKIRLGHYAAGSPLAALVGRIRTAFDLRPEQEIGFDQFSEFVCAMPDRDREHHVMSQRMQLLTDFIDYHYAVRTDDYAAGMADVLSAIGVPKRRRPDLTERHNSSCCDAVLVSKATSDRIRKAYSGDYDLIRAFERAGATRPAR